MANENLPAKVLVVDDDPTITKKLEFELQKFEIKVIPAKDLDSALYHFNQSLFDVVIIELEFEPLPGLALVQKWRHHDNKERTMTGMILAAGRQRKATDDALLKELGGIEVINKPCSAVQVMPFLSRALATKRRNMRFEEIRTTVMKLAAQNGKVDKAIAVVEKQLVALGPKGLEIMADIYERDGQHGEALKVVDKMLEQNPGSIAHMNVKGRLLLQMGRHDEALKFMEEADKAAPQNIDRINAMATLYLHMHNPDASVEKMKEIIALNPEHPDTKFEMFGRLYDFGFDEKAQALCKETTGPMEVVRHYNNKGVALSKSGNPWAAITEYERSLKFYPQFKENYRILYNIALALVAEKKRENFVKALECIERALKLEPAFEKGEKMKEMIQTALAPKKKPAQAS